MCGLWKDCYPDLAEKDQDTTIFDKTFKQQSDQRVHNIDNNFHSTLDPNISIFPISREEI